MGLTKDSTKLIEYKTSCGNCRFFIENENVQLGAIRRGWCRRYPPQSYTQQCNDGYDSEDYVSSYDAWPEVKVNNWCGEFESKELLKDLPFAIYNTNNPDDINACIQIFKGQLSEMQKFLETLDNEKLSSMRKK